MSATRASCFTLTIKQITHVLFKSQIENIHTLGLVLLADVFFLHKQLQMENNGNWQIIWPMNHFLEPSCWFSVNAPTKWTSVDTNIFTTVSVDSSSMEAFSTEQPITSSGTRMPQSPRRPTHQLPPRLNIHAAPTSELGPPAQVQVWWALCPLSEENFSLLSFSILYYHLYHSRTQSFLWPCSVYLSVVSLSSHRGRQPAV